MSGRGSRPSPAAGPPPTQHLRPAPAAPPTCSVLLLPRSCGLCGPPVTAGSARARGNWTEGLTAVQHPSRGRSLRGGSTPHPQPSPREQSLVEDAGVGRGMRADPERCGEEGSLGLRLESRTTGFGPGSASDYDVTLGRFLPFSGLGSSSVKCGGRQG